jgi:hypothetical protein
MGVLFVCRLFHGVSGVMIVGVKFWGGYARKMGFCQWESWQAN